MKAHLTISTYSGLVPGASHYYGRLRFGRNDEEEVTRELTESEAARLNIEARRQGEYSDFKWEAGNSSGRFWDQEALIARAIEQVKTDHPEVTILFQGDHYVCDPQPVLLGPEPLKTQANAIVAEAEANDWWEGDKDKMEEISQRWQALFPRR